MLRVGVDIGAKTFTPREEEREVVKTEKIAKVMGQLMGDDNRVWPSDRRSYNKD